MNLRCRQNKINLLENHKANSIKNKLHFIIGTIDCILKKKYFDIIIMNMIRTHSEPLLAKVHTLLKDDGLLIWSGILTNECQNVITVARTHNFKLIKETADNDWWCGIFQKCPINIYKKNISSSSANEQD